MERIQFFENGKLNAQVFDADVRRATHDLNDVVAAAAETSSSVVESTHFLMALAQLEGDVMEKSLARRQLTLEHWRRGLAQCAVSSPGTRPPPQLDEASLDSSARSMLAAAKARCEQEGYSRVGGVVLLRYGLEHVTSAVRDLCGLAGVDLDAWRQELEDVISPRPALAVFAGDPPHAVLLDSFSASGKNVLRLMQAEAEAMGYKEVDARHLLLALLGCDGSMTQFGLQAQGVRAEKAHAGVMLSLRLNARRVRSSAPLDLAHLQPLVQHMLSSAAEFAQQDGAGKIAEAHLLKGFLAVESAARRLLDDHGVNCHQLRKAAEAFDASVEEDDEEAAVADIEAVRRRLQSHLVGQDRVIDQILPYVELMRFDFRTAGRPVGVFLFCGQSGSGKTEMAKELARAVYGSEENLIFLEMGQFNSPESMNIFVGAPPGYIGYGQGKLTNGLRDKPRAVVLFDEVEKAHRRVLDALLRFLDEGRIDDPAGPVRDGSECLVILTSNEAADEVARLQKEVHDTSNWRTVLRQRLREIFAKSEFRAEFLNRVDEILLFRSLSQAEYTEIAARQLARIVERLKNERQIEVVADASIAKMIGTYCAAIEEGARVVPRLLKSVVVLPVCRFVLQNNCSAPVRVRVYTERATADGTCEPTGMVEFD